MSFNFITIKVELNQINALTFTGTLFLTSEFEITHIFFFSLKLRLFYLNRWILISGDSVIWLHFTATFEPVLAEKKPNRFQVIAFCFKEDNKSCYVTHVNFSSSTLFKDIVIFLLTSYKLKFYRIVFLFLFWFRWYQWFFVGLTVVKTQTEMFVCIRHFQKVHSITVRDVIANANAAFRYRIDTAF